MLIRTLLPFCNCGLLEFETTNHFLLHCCFFTNTSRNLSLGQHCWTHRNFIKSLLIEFGVLFLLCGNETFNISILKATISFLNSSERFDVLFISNNYSFFFCCPFYCITLFAKTLFLLVWLSFFFSSFVYLKLR